MLTEGYGFTSRVAAADGLNECFLFPVFPKSEVHTVQYTFRKYSTVEEWYWSDIVTVGTVSIVCCGSTLVQSLANEASPLRTAATQLYTSYPGLEATQAHVRRRIVQ